MSSLLGAVAPAIVGGLLGGGSKGPSQTTSKATDPRLDPYMYGGGDVSGYLPDLAAFYANNKSGLNDQMREGLNRQYAVYSDPNNAQGYTNISNVGQSLLGISPAGNGYGQQGLMAMGGAGLPASGGRYQPPMGQPMGNMGTMPHQMPQMPQGITPTYAQSPAGQGAPLGPFSSAPTPVPAQAPAQAAQDPSQSDLAAFMAKQGYGDPNFASWNLKALGLAPTPLSQWRPQSDFHE